MERYAHVYKLLKQVQAVILTAQQPFGDTSDEKGYVDPNDKMHDNYTVTFTTEVITEEKKWNVKSQFSPLGIQRTLCFVVC